MSDQVPPPGRPDEPTGDQPTQEWSTPPEPPPPEPPAQTPSPAEPPPPSAGLPSQPPAWPSPQQPASPYGTGTGPLLSAAPTSTTGWTQPPTAAQEIAPGLVFSGTAARFVALLIDLFLLGIVTSVISATVGSGAAVNPSGQLTWTTRDFIASVIGVVINAAYFIGFWSGGRRATLGQMLLKIQVGNAFDGRPLTMEQAIRRWFGLGQFLSFFAISAAAVGLIAAVSLVWDLVLLISTTSSPTKQGLHDRFANSAVVRPADAGNGLVYTCLFLIILPILFLLAIIALVFIGGQTSAILSAVGNSIQP